MGVGRLLLARVTEVVAAKVTLPAKRVLAVLDADAAAVRRLQHRTLDIQGEEDDVMDGGTAPASSGQRSAQIIGDRQEHTQPNTDQACWVVERTCCDW